MNEIQLFFRDLIRPTAATHQNLGSRTKKHLHYYAISDLLPRERLQHSEYKTKHLGRLLGEDAAFFVRMLCDLYRKASDVDAQTDSAVTLDDATKTRVDNALRILRLWKGYPGDDKPAEERDRILRRWCDEVMRLAKEADREAIGKEEVGEILERVPPYEGDGVWPCLVARKYIESGITEIGSRLSVAHFNRRGVISRSLSEGGAQERKSSAAYYAAADRIRDNYPRTAALIDGGAQNLLWYAERADSDAEQFIDP